MTAPTTVRVRLTSAGRWINASMTRWLDRPVWPTGLRRRDLIAHRSRTIGLSTVGAMATYTVWSAIGPATVAYGRDLVSALMVAGPRAQDRAIAIVIGVWLLAWWIARAVRLASSRRLAARMSPQPPIVTVGAARARGVSAVDERVARHEAAHAVVAHAMGATLLMVRAVPNDESAGRCSWSAKSEKCASDEAWRELCSAVAGAVEVTEGAHAWPGSRDDWGQAAAAAMFIASSGGRPVGFAGPLSVDRLLEAARGHAAALLAANAPALDELTAALVARGTLDGEDAVAILTGVKPAATGR
ncbi:hypothetical protein [Cellulomonas sp. Y8]|uniref:hypothetical protein n=1 Tax=Cellulomonas sp. Y8 TaxID=2591145 RepID=UPI0011C72017|nr:hypothetical protein [Cellulomonas sp. Y8]